MVGGRFFHPAVIWIPCCFFSTTAYFPCTFNGVVGVRREFIAASIFQRERERGVREGGREGGMEREVEREREMGGWWEGMVRNIKDAIVAVHKVALRGGPKQTQHARDQPKETQTGQINHNVESNCRFRINAELRVIHRACSDIFGQVTVRFDFGDSVSGQIGSLKPELNHNSPTNIRTYPKQLYVTPTFVYISNSAVGFALLTGIASWEPKLVKHLKSGFRTEPTFGFSI